MHKGSANNFSNYMCVQRAREVRIYTSPTSTTTTPSTLLSTPEDNDDGADGADGDDDADAAHRCVSGCDKMFLNDENIRLLDGPARSQFAFLTGYGRRTC